MKKLQLKSTTIRTLTDNNLTQVNGGWPSETPQYPGSAACTGPRVTYNGCMTVRTLAETP